MGFPDDVNDRDWIEKARILLERARVRHGYYRFTQPSPDATGLQSPWNSALHAIVYRWFDPEMAGDELKSAVANPVRSGPDEGMISGMVDWREDPPAASAYTAPPLLAFAAMQVYHFTGDPNLLERVYAPLAAWHAWFDRRRDDDGDGLVRVDHPEEFIVAGSGVNIDVARSADLDGLAHLAQDMGNRAEASRWDRRAAAVRAALQSIPMDMYDRINATLLTMLFGRGIPEADAAALVQRVQAQARADRLFPWLVESGNPISMVDNWLIYLGLRRYGFAGFASQVAESSFRLVERHGFRQFYDATGGEGVGAVDYGASALALDMVFREKSGRAPKPQCIQDVD